MTEPNFISQEAGLNFNTVVEAIIKRSCIIDFGIVQDVVSDGIVDVAVAVSKTKQDMLCMTCVLANIASKAFTLNVKPHKGDRVLVVYPRLYDDKMFNFTGSEGDDTKLIENYEAKGYNLASGIAILLNQYKESGHKNVITIDEDSLKMEINNGKTKMQIDNSGNVTVETKGKYNIKNNSTNLFKVIDGLAKELENLTTQGSPATQATSPASKTSIANWRSSKLKQLIEDN
jgi:hypothetical protein